MSDHKIRTLTWLLIAFVASIALMAVIGFLTYSGTDQGYGYHYGMMGGGGWGWVMALMVVPVVLLIVIIVYAIVGTTERTSYGPYPVYMDSQRPIDILNYRYARGEISREEYDRIRSELGVH